MYAERKKNFSVWKNEKDLLFIAICSKECVCSEKSVQTRFFQNIVSFGKSNDFSKGLPFGKSNDFLEGLSLHVNFK